MEKTIKIRHRYTLYYNNKIIRGDLQSIIFSDHLVNNYGNIYTKKITTIVINNVDNEINKKTRVCIPISMISKIENLETIINGYCIFPDDILFLIDKNY